MTFELFLQYIFAGLTYGIIYAIVAIGFNIIYNTTGIINFAQGEFVMLGGMIAISLNHFLPLPIAILLAVLITMLVGALIEVVFIRWLDKPSVLISLQMPDEQTQQVIAETNVKVGWEDQDTAILKSR